MLYLMVEIIIFVGGAYLALLGLTPDYSSLREPYGVLGNEP